MNTLNIFTEDFENMIYKAKANTLSKKELSDLFACLDPVSFNEMIGEWKIGYLFTNDVVSISEVFIKNFPIKLYSKNFLTKDNVKAWIIRIFGIKFSVPMASAVLKMINFKDKISVSMVYNYLPIVDHFRKINDNTVMGVMEIRGDISMYFYLTRL